jgi:hypothetical protein
MTTTGKKGNSNISEELVRELARSEIKKEFELTNIPKPLGGVLALLLFFGIKLTAKSVFFIVPIFISTVIAVFLYGLDFAGTWLASKKIEAEFAEFQETNTINFTQLNNELDTLAVKTGNNNDRLVHIVDLLNDFPDGYWVQSINLSSKEGRLLYLPLHCDFTVKMRIVRPDSIETEDLEKYLMFRINQRAVEGVGILDGDDKGWSPVTPFIEQNETLRGTRDVFKRGKVQKIEFRVSKRADEEILDQFNNAHIAILFVVERQFTTQSVRPMDKEEEEEEVAITPVSGTQCS